MRMKTNRKLKLCVVCPVHWSAFMGGSQYQIKCIVDELVPSGRYEVSYIANEINPEFTATNHTVYQVGGAVRKLGYMPHLVHLYRELKRIKPDVIYQRVACGYTGIAAWYANKNKARMVWHVAHEGDVVRGNLIYGRNPIRRSLEQMSVIYGLRRADAIVTQTADQADLLFSNFGRSADAIVPNFHPAPSEDIDKSGPVTVTWIANLKLWKQPEKFIHLARALSDMPNVRFLMVGAPPPIFGESKWHHEIMDLISSVKNLTYLGKRSQAEVNEILAKSHVFVNTSLHEGFANTFIQAWMRHVPVVSLHENPDGVFDAEEVGICASGCESKLASAVRSLAEDAVRRDAMGARGYRHAMRNHSVDNATLLAEIFESGAVHD